MTLLVSIATQLLHLLLMLAAAPLLVGLIRLCKARLLGRTGADILQPWRDLIRLSRKQPVLAEGTSWLFRGAPIVAFAAILAAATLVPSFALGMVSASVADLLVILGLLTLARCALALAGMDSGTAFGGLGASREMTFSAFAEPAMMLVIFTLALLVGSTNLDVVAGLLREASFGLRVSLGLALVATIAIAIAETGRIPVDNPATHLELTMVHEAMVLEYSGRHLALIEWGAALKLLLWISLISVIFVPFGTATLDSGPITWLLALPLWTLKVVLLAVALALFETAMAKMRIFRVPEFLGVALLLGLLAAVFLFVSQGFA
ncbi:Formate hydrogenlyase subunit 4 [Rhodovastum atsumiense]|uniref:Formate hydrogenlyase n=1 Tax=Rhodovastum atsumiense TaxID=504468 RepID=A0A5M6IYB6_9PROT|nr:NADH-quinone oxidoreductase subunit H [Rhodovastum atsumiense]KAA5612949.1 formate hydrogenlyase [Rhodovastum atsumiense]CAH2600959.1 Formate hydrogenlyase subunit 4 [Rhodovastum atsumiense]